MQIDETNRDQNEKLLRPGEAEKLIQSAAFTLDAIIVYLEKHPEDTTTARNAEREFQYLVNRYESSSFNVLELQYHEGATKLISSIAYECYELSERKTHRLTTLFAGLRSDADGLRSSPDRDEFAPVFAAEVMNIFKSIAHRRKDEIELMSSNIWLAYKDLWLMKLNLDDMWLKALGHLNGLCQNLILSGNSGIGYGPGFDPLKQMFKQVGRT